MIYGLLRIFAKKDSRFNSNPGHCIHFTHTAIANVTILLMQRIDRLEEVKTSIADVAIIDKSDLHFISPR
jgi:hypothetical protein